MDPLKHSVQTGARRGEASDEPMRFAGATLGKQRHVCAFFHSREEEYRVLLPFIKEGFVRDEKAFHVINPGLRDDHLRRLESAGIEVTETQKDGQFELRDWEEAYFREGGFDQNKMLAMPVFFNEPLIHANVR